MIYTNITPALKPISFFFQRHRIRRLAKAKLLQEINFNLRLIDMIEWIGVSAEFKNKVVGEFTLKEFENFIEVCSEDVFDRINKKMVEFEDENLDDKKVEKTELLSNLINKIKTLQLIAEFNKDFEADNKSRFDKRLNNIKKGLNELKQTLNS
jgi:hypothetical protein